MRVASRFRRLAVAGGGKALGVLLAAAFLVAPSPVRAAPPDDLVLMEVPAELDYPAWMARFGWRDERPFSDSSERFRVEDGALRLESAGDSFLIAMALPEALRRSLATHPYLRFVVRVDMVPRGANLIGETQDDSALRVYAAFRDDPPRTIVYAWTWTLPLGQWSARGWSILQDFRQVRRKSFGQGAPPAGAWLTVETDLRADYRHEFPNGNMPALQGLALKADSNHTSGGRSLAWVRTISLHAHSLHEQGLHEGDAYQGTVLWFR